MIHDLEDRIDKEEFITMCYIDNIKFLAVYFDLITDRYKTFNTDGVFDVGDYLMDEVEDRLQCLKKRKFIKSEKGGWSITRKSHKIIKAFFI